MNKNDNGLTSKYIQIAGVQVQQNMIILMVARVSTYSKIAK